MVPSHSLTNNPHFPFPPSSFLAVTLVGSDTVQIKDKELETKHYQATVAYDGDTNNEDFFHRSDMSSLALAAMEGFTSTVFAYGQVRATQYIHVERSV